MRSCSLRAVFMRSCIICTDKDINNITTSVVKNLFFIFYPEKLPVAGSVGIHITVRDILFYGIFICSNIKA